MPFSLSPTKLIHRFDQYVAAPSAVADISGMRRFAIEFWMFGIKEARACLFAGLFFFALFASHKLRGIGLPRYDLLLLIAVGIRIWMLQAKRERPLVRLLDFPREASAAECAST